MKINPLFRKNTFRISLRFQSFVLYLALAGVFLLTSCSKTPENAFDTNSDASIFPEYYNLTIPPNIAPLNFIIKETGSRFRIEISGSDSKKITIQQRSAKIKIPIDKWQKILSENAGGKVKIEIRTFNKKRWNKYKLIEHNISTDPIDPYLAYRLVHAVYLKWNKMGIYQRNMSSFNESPVIENSSTDKGCVNCHTFSNNDPSKMLIHFRILYPGTLIWDEGKLSKINTRTSSTLSAGIYPAWHPDGKHIAFSSGKISPHLTTRLNKVVDVADRASDIAVYDIENNIMHTTPKLSTSKRENMPLWSIDGKYLYFTSAPEAIAGYDESLLHSKYSLMRIAYDAKQNKWGEVEMVINSDDTGMSISKPSMSPDGKYIVCSMSDFGYFTIFHKESDLYLVNLESKEFKKLKLNSSSAESHSTWSSNGRWIVFSSKRIDDVYTRPHIAYFDENGNTHTPFVLPQKDPEMYDRLFANYNLPELIRGKIELSPIEIRDFVIETPLQAEIE